jgi:ABC-type branched-subunit amino acid transport system substrate-binding protein
VALVVCVVVSACSGSGEPSATNPTTATSTSISALTSTSATLPSSTAPTTTVAPAWTVNTSGCLDPAQATEPLGDVVRLGVIGPTGQGLRAAAAIGVVDGMRAFYDLANREGLVPGVTIELVVGDDAGDPGASVAIMAGLLDEGVELFSGNIGTPTNVALRGELNSRCIPQLFALSPAAGWDAVLQSPWTTGGMASVSLEARAIVADADRVGARSFGILYADNDIGRFYRDALSGSVGDPARVIAGQAVDPAQPVVAAETVAPLAAARPDAVLLAPVAAGCVTALTSLEPLITAEWQPRVYMPQSCMNRLTARLAGDASDDVFTVSEVIDVVDPANAAVPAMVQFTQSLTLQPSPLYLNNAAFGWHIAELTTAVLAEAARSPDGLTKVSIIEAARSMDATSGLAWSGARFVTDGLADAVPSSAVQVVRWDGEAGVFRPEGPLFEG